MIQGIYLKMAVAVVAQFLNIGISENQTFKNLQEKEYKISKTVCEFFVSPSG